jgi:pSer/pThr/pTyr-binding forkhead associated (FHA) protein
MSRGRWIWRFVEGKYSGAEFPIDRDSILIGRHPDLDMVLHDDAVSERHARISLAEGATWLEDLGSENGTFVNDQRIERVALAPGDRVRIAAHVIDVLDTTTRANG